MANTGILLSYGAAPYKDDPKNNPSYFVELESDGQKRKIWGVGLEEAMQKTQAKQGDNVVVNNLGNKSISIPDPENPSKSLQVRRNIWEVEEYEPPKELPNSMEQAVSREINRDSDADASMNTASIPKEKLDEFSEYELPSSIKNNYIVIAKNRFLNDEKFNFYAKDDSGKTDIVFEDRKTSINTSRQDEKTVNAMIDIAESKGWSSIKIKGTEEFKQKAWLEASLRGIEIQGYQPTERDLATLQAEKESRSINIIIGEKAERSLSNQGQGIIEKEAYIRSAEFEAGRDIDPDLDTNLEAETERFHDNLAAPSIKGMSREESMLATERAFDRRVQNAMPQRDDLRRELGINKEDVKNIVQNGYRDGSIKNRDDLVARLQDHGFEIVRQSDKSITLSNPRGKDLRLDGEIFAKDFDALKELKNNLEPDNIRKAYPNIKDTQIAQIELQKQHLLNKFTTPQSQQQALHKLHATLPEIAAGRTDLGAPVPPSISSPNVQVRTPDTGDKSRSR